MALSSSPTEGTTLADQVAVRRISLNTKSGTSTFISSHLPTRIGNPLPIAYGGCALGVAVSSAYQTLPSPTSSSPKYHLYSLLGHYLGPASSSLPLHITVTPTRTTRSFCTRRIQVSQSHEKDGKESRRVVVDMFADFHAEEPVSVLLGPYSAQPSLSYAGPDGVPGMSNVRARLLAEGKIDGETARMSAATWDAWERFLETRECIEGVSSQNLTGSLKSAPTTQDHLPAPEKTSAEWLRASPSSSSSASGGEAGGAEWDEATQMAALAFTMDGGLAFLPLAHGQLWFEDTSACSSLDFALRVFGRGVDMRGWMLRERRVVGAGEGRTYSEGRLWDGMNGMEGGREEGRLVASMTSQAILRPKGKAML